MICELDYIPSHLHSNDRPIVESFSIGEKLYYRCLPKNLSKPYDNINLRDISHNRNFCDDEQYGSDCVLWEAVGNKDFQRYEEHNFIELLIEKISENTYHKRFSKNNPNNNENFVVEISLKHDPIPCMYLHSVFEIKMNGVIVTEENYNTGFGKRNQFFNLYRNEVRQELTSMMQTGKINNSSETEIITEP